MSDNKFCFSYSTGKDSALALYKMLQSDLKPVALIVAMSDEIHRSWFHGVDIELVDKVCESIGIPVIKALGNSSNYEEVFVEALQKAKNLGATMVGFGDIDLDENKEWGENVAKKAGLKPVFPLWKKKREVIIDELLDAGFKTMIKTVTKKHGVPTSYLGKTLTHEIVNDFKEMGIDICGENGEYHTFVYEGPIFNQPISFEIQDVHESEYSYSKIIQYKK